jgi:putative aldouronate transport system substrate-binding protein
VKVIYQHPAAGQNATAFSILVASGAMPDMIEYDWTLFPGGPTAAIKNNVILKLNNYITKDAPDLTNLVKATPKYGKEFSTDDGSEYGFPIMKPVELLTTYGLAIRTDWLKDLNLQLPETIDEWHTVLTAFKNQKGATAALSYTGAVAGTNFSNTALLPFTAGMFTGAYGITLGLYTDSGNVKYGPYQSAYKDWLTTMSQWYKEGLLDSNFATTDRKALDANILIGKTGAAAMYPGSGLGTYIPALRAKNPNAGMGATKFPVLKKGDKPQFSSLLNDVCSAVCITTSCKNPDIAAKWLNYGYSEKGHMLNSFGILGVSYNLTSSGFPQLTDEVLKNPKGLSIGEAISQYARDAYLFAGMLDMDYYKQYYVYPEQMDALKMWTDTDMAKHLLPPISLTVDESTQVAKIINDVASYVNEYSLKIIMGKESISGFDAYTAQLKSMNVEKFISIEQAALNRYNKK